MTSADLATPPRRKSPQLGRKFGMLWSASAISSVGDGMRDSALPLLAVAVSDSPGAVSVVSVAASLPFLLMSLYGGVLADRADRRRLMWTIDSLRAAVVLGFAAWVYLADPPLAVLAALAFVLGCGETVFSNAATSVIPEVVRPDQLDAANGRMQGNMLVGGNLIGPLLGSALFAVAAGLPFTVDGVSFALAALLVAATGRSTTRPSRTSRPVLTEIREGVTWLYHHRDVRMLAVLSTLGAMTCFMGTTMMVLMVTRVVHAPAASYGIVLAAGAIGGTAASTLAGRLSRLMSRGARIAMAFLLMGISLILMGMSTSVAEIAALYGVIGFGIVTWNVQAISLRQQAVPKELLGRVNSCYMLLSRLGIMTGAALSGWIASVTSVRTPLFLGGCLLLVLLVAVLLLLPRMSALEPSPSAEAAEQPVDEPAGRPAD
ncbi:MFS transporter [Streptomyces sp. FH025]|uniref:MFS transporter n=1 Tax=Streptomyces sp. FH025 TaxID=2815937 RepID=UPI001A9EBD83|nr:MFS transporter [Streptomyces sp. FH025]MBO1417532.1 MFS transporter [Streptomyces sp. FH025]